MQTKSVLVVEDEENLLAALRYNLERDGYTVHTASDGESALRSARLHSPDIVVLDVLLPLLDGFELCRIIRQESDVPIVMLTAKGDEMDRVVGLELGADDYVVKPFSMRELLARLRAMLRRSRSAEGPRTRDEGPVTLRSMDLDIDPSAHLVTLAGAPISLKPREYDLLAMLVENKGRALTRDQILDRLWGEDYIGDTRTVDVHVRWLRKKIEADPARPKRITTVRGVGYRFEG